MAIAGLPWRQDRIAKPKSENEDEESQSAPEPSLKSRAGPSPSQEKEKPILPPTPEEAKGNIVIRMKACQSIFIKRHEIHPIFRNMQTPSGSRTVQSSYSAIRLGR